MSAAKALLAMPIVGMKDGRFQQTRWYASTEESCSVSENAPIVDANGETVALVVFASDEFYRGASPEIEARAEFIVRACNSHDAMVAALQQIAGGKVMVGEFTHVDTIQKYQDIASVALAAAGAA